MCGLKYGPKFKIGKCRCDFDSSACFSRLNNVNGREQLWKSNSYLCTTVHTNRDTTRVHFRIRLDVNSRCAIVAQVLRCLVRLSPSLVVFGARTRFGISLGSETPETSSNHVFCIQSNHMIERSQAHVWMDNRLDLLHECASNTSSPGSRSTRSKLCSGSSAHFRSAGIRPDTAPRYALSATIVATQHPCR